MSSIINAGTSGVTITGSTSTVLSLATNGTTRLNIDASGNLAVGTGNLTFSSTAQRITGDMSNATITNRLLFQNSTANSGTEVGIIPNGTGTSGVLNIYPNSDPTNTGYLRLVCLQNSDARILSQITGTGTYLPMTFYTGGSERMRLDTSGNLGIGTASPASGVRLDVQDANAISRLTSTTGTNAVRFQLVNTGGTSTLGRESSGGGTILSGADGYSTVLNSTGAYPVIFGVNGSERMRIDSSGNVGIGGTASAFAKVHVLGTLPSSSNATQVFRASGEIPSGTTSAAEMFLTVPSTQAASFTLTHLRHYVAVQDTIGAGSTVTNQVGFRVSNTLTGATNNYGFYSDIASGTNRWNFYANGTALNYFAGNTGVGVNPATWPDYRLSVQNTGVNNAALFINDQNTSSTVFVWNKATSGDNVFTQFGTDGGATVRGSIDYNRAGGAVRYNTTSDYRAKDVYGAWDDAGATIDALKVYRGKMHGAYLERPMLIAHEAQAVVPYAVSGEKDAVDKDGKPKYQTMDHQILVPLLIAELQAVRTRLAALEAK